MSTQEPLLQILRAAGLNWVEPAEPPDPIESHDVEADEDLLRLIALCDEMQTTFGWIQSAPSGSETVGGLSYVVDLLNGSADLFKERNAVYKDNFRMVGRIMKALFPDGPPRLETEADYNRWHLFELAIVKLSRYVIKFDEGGHPDSIDDMIVYLAMVAALDRENGHRA